MGKCGVKFLCDRCKTRYSIGDDRVRGKILKIRCKNCANVITVREGMNALDDVAAADRRMRPTTAAPIAAATTTAPTAGGGSALANAFVAQMTTKPPPALEEEWYVSIDGDQQGPFSLADAQKWIAAKPFDAELHCWSEGFDDWLPVDKVSHFRNLRKKPMPPPRPATSGAPPLPRVAPQRNTPVAVAQHQQEEEPKPLFAATMAALEKGTIPPPVAMQMPAPRAPLSPTTPANGIVAKANGTGSAAVPQLAKAGKTGPTGPTRAGTQQGVVGKSAGAQAIAAAFDTSSDAGESHTSVDSPAFHDEISTRAEPIAAKRAFDRVDAVAKPDYRENGANGHSDHGVPELPDEDMLDIGEVSRVVKLADLAKMGSQSNARKTSRAPLVTSGRATGAAASLQLRATGSVPKLDPAVLLAAADPANQQPLGDAAPGESLVVAPVVAKAHRRGLMLLISVAAILLIGVTVLVVFMVQNHDDGNGGGLGHTKEIDTSRPEEVVRAHMMPDGPGSAAVTQHVTPQHHNPIRPNTGSNTDDTPGTGAKIKSEEIEDMAGKNSQGTQRCYMRAQRGVEGIAIQDLKKLTVTITIDKTGVVSDVQFSDHGADSLGICLSSMIKRWKFRESPGGLYRFVLAFAS